MLNLDRKTLCINWMLCLNPHMSYISFFPTKHTDTHFRPINYFIYHDLLNQQLYTVLLLLRMGSRVRGPFFLLNDPFTMYPFYNCSRTTGVTPRHVPQGSTGWYSTLLRWKTFRFLRTNPLWGRETTPLVLDQGYRSHINIPYRVCIRNTDEVVETRKSPCLLLGRVFYLRGLTVTRTCSLGNGELYFFTFL